jgi:hypothetical protein
VFWPDLWVEIGGVVLIVTVLTINWYSGARAERDQAKETHAA